MEDKTQQCPHCKQTMKYRGSHIFLCKNCKRLWELIQGRYQSEQTKDGIISKLIRNKSHSNWTCLAHNARR